MRLHLAALPGQPVGGPESDPTCAYTTKVRRFPKMMAGHEVIVYGDPRHDHDGEHVAAYPKSDPPEFTAEEWEPFNRSAAKAIRHRMEPGDVLGIIGGLAQEQLIHDLPELIPVEYGIGYGGVCAGTHKVFESYAWMHTVYGATRGSHSADGSFYDAVIPAYFDLEDYDVEPDPKDYVLYVGRLTQRKGIEIACETAKRLGVPLILAGQGEYEPAYGECVGVVGPQERAKLMAGALCVMCPTIYVEPFAQVHVEAQLCGAPVISTDWGVFTETVEQGVNGYRCRTLGEFMWAVDEVSRWDVLDRLKIQDRAREKWSLEQIGREYEAYFRRLETLKGRGWYDESMRSPAGVLSGC